VQKVIRGIREQNEALKRVVGQRMEELKEVRPAEFVPRAERQKKQFETIGDVE
jgi:hypothetical protein